MRRARAVEVTLEIHTTASVDDIADHFHWEGSRFPIAGGAGWVEMEITHVRVRDLAAVVRPQARRKPRRKP